MTETELFLIMANGFVVFVAASLFVRLLCDEYVRQLDAHGLIRRPAGESEPPSTQA